MKVLQVVHDFPPHAWRGTEVYTLGLALALGRQGVETAVVHPRRGAGSGALCRDRFQGLDVWAVDLPSTVDLMDTAINRPAAARVMELARQGDFDVVHVQHPMGLTGAVIEAAAARGLATVLTLHDFWLICELVTLGAASGLSCSGPDAPGKCLECVRRHLLPGIDDPDQEAYLEQYRRTKAAFNRRVFDLAGRVVAVSEFVREVFVRHGYDRPGFLVAGPGVTPFAVNGDRRRPNHRPVFVCLGNLSPQKGALRLTRASSRAVGRVGPGRAELRLYGRAQNPDYFRAVMDAVDACADVSYHGPYQPEDRGRILAEADMVVVPSLMETYSLTLREGLFAGRPVLASRRGGLPEAVTDGFNGRLFDPDDEDELTGILGQIISTPDLIDAWAQNVTPPPSVDDEALMWLDLYARVAAEAAR